MSFQFSPEVLLGDLQEQLEGFNLESQASIAEVERLTQKRIENRQGSIAPLQRAGKEKARLDTVIEKIKSQIGLLKAEIEFRQPVTQIPELQQIGDITPPLPMITTQDNTLRNALIVGGVLLLIL